MKYPKPVHKKKSKVSEWIQVRAQLKQQFAEAGITHCEIGLLGCTYTWYLGFAHTKKRRKITTKEELRRVVLACQNCHEKVEYFSPENTREDMETFLEGIIAKRKFVIPVIY